MDGAWFIADCPEISGKSAGRDQSKKPVGVWWRPPNSFLWTSAMTVSVESRESRFVRRSLLNGDSLVTGTRDAPPYCFGASRGGLRLWRDRDVVRDVLDELVAGVINRKLAAETQHVIPGRQTMDKGEETIGYGRRHCAADINSKELVQVVGRRQPEGKRPRPQPLACPVSIGAGDGGRTKLWDEE